MDKKKLPQLTRNFIVLLNTKNVVYQIIAPHTKPLDYKLSQIIGKNFTNFISKDSIDKFNNQLKNLELKKIIRVDYKLITKKNVIEWYKLSFLKEKSTVIIYCNEIDLYKISETNEAFKSLADLAPMPILGFEYPSLNLNYSNKNFKKELGFDFSEIQHFSQWHQRIVFKDEDDKK